METQKKTLVAYFEESQERLSLLEKELEDTRKRLESKENSERVMREIIKRVFYTRIFNQFFKVSEICGDDCDPEKFDSVSLCESLSKIFGYTNKPKIELAIMVSAGILYFIP